jgi:hypothetical protein
VKEKAMVPNNRIERFLSKSSITRSLTLYPGQRPNGFAFDKGLDRAARPDSASEFFVRLPNDGTRPLFNRRPTVEEIRFHAALFDRLAALRHARRSIWSKIRGFIRGD